jgi:hypothetical protein
MLLYETLYLQKDKSILTSGSVGPYQSTNKLSGPFSGSALAGVFAVIVVSETIDLTSRLRWPLRVGGTESRGVVTLVSVGRLLCQAGGSSLSSG